MPPLHISLNAENMADRRSQCYLDMLQNPDMLVPAVYFKNDLLWFIATVAYHQKYVL